MKESVKINPLTQRCITVSREHEWRDIYETLEYFDKSETNWTIKEHQHVVKKAVWKNNRPVVKCLHCGLVDDIHGGEYK